MIMKKYDNDLLSTIHNFQKKEKLWFKKVFIGLVKGIVSGMQFMHESSVIHNDLKSANILIETMADGSLNAIISDFVML